MRSEIAILAFAVQAGAAIYHVDCRAGSDAVDGLSPAAAWRSLERVNRQTYEPGDSILLRRGTACEGMLRPLGSGRQGAPITIGAYGTGRLPLIEGGSNEAALRLFNQQYWHIRNIETTGGAIYGIHVGGDSGPLRHFRIRDVVVRDVKGPLKSKSSGLIAVLGGGPQARLEDIVIDGATAYNTTQWAGIIVNGGAFRGATPANWAVDVTIRNSAVHDVYGDGIILFQVVRGRIEKCAAWDTGMQPTQTIGTPNAIWTWRCRDCVVAYNEGYRSDSPGVDGGVFDIDWGDDDNIVEHNFGHESQGYCVSVFGAGGGVTTNSIVRHNTCLNNGRSPRLAKRHGAIYLFTWDKGALDGVLIHDNVIYWDPPTDAPALINQAEYTGQRPNRFFGNTIVSKLSNLIDSNPRLTLEGNRVLPSGPRVPAAAPENLVLKDYRGRWSLLSFLDPDSGAARSQAVFIRSMARQFAAKGLRVAVAGGAANLAHDWNLEELEFLPESENAALRKACNVRQSPVTLLIRPDGSVAQRWSGFAAAEELYFPLVRALGPPRGAVASQDIM